MSILLKIIYIVGALYLLVCILLYFFQERLIFFPEKLSADYQFHFEGDFEEKFFQVDDEITIHALHFFAKDAKGTILYFHGNAGSLKDWGHVAVEFTQLNYNVLISDYRGFGKSIGNKSEEGFYNDAQLLYDFLLEKNDSKDVIIYGRSIGTGVAVDLASKNDVQKLILETPFTNFSSLAQSRFKIFPVKALLQFKFNNLEKISKINFPIHIFHGTKDEVIPYAESQRIIEYLKNPSIMTTIENGYHNNLGDFELYWKKIKEIL